MAKEKKISICVGSYTEAAEKFAAKKVKDLKAAGFKGAKMIQAEKYLRVITGEEFTDQEAAKVAVKDMAQNGIEGFTIEL